MQLNKSGVLAEVEAAFRAYETALVTNDVAALGRFFWKDDLTIRYGAGEVLHGHDEISRFRAARDPANLDRMLSRTVITTFGDDLATANTLFRRDSAPGKLGRQSQTWVRMPEGWRIVSAHVSLIDEPREG